MSALRLLRKLLMQLSGTPAEILDFLRGLCGWCRDPAASVSITFKYKGKSMNPITVGPGSNVTGTVTGKQADGSPGTVAAPVSWTLTGLDGASSAPSPDTLSTVIQLPASGSGTLTVSLTTADGLTASGVINVAEGPAVSVSMDFSVNSPGAAKPPA